MRIVINKTHEPIHVVLGGGHVLHLEPHGRGQLSDSSVDSRGVRALLDEDRIEVLAAGPAPRQRPHRNPGGGGRTTGHHPPIRGKRRGNR